MAARKKGKKGRAPVSTQPPRIYEATLERGPSGWVLRGFELDLAAAIARRQAGNDVVVCGGALRANRTLARTIEEGVGTPTRPQNPHKHAGPHALPHFHQESRTVGGHTFYETDNRQRNAKKAS
jgi:hypothetical protein